MINIRSSVPVYVTTHGPGGCVCVCARARARLLSFCSFHHRRGRVGSAHPAWLACRDEDLRAAAASDPRGLSAGALASSEGWEHEAVSGACIENASVPGTALVNLLRNGTFGDFGGGEVPTSSGHANALLANLNACVMCHTLSVTIPVSG